MLGQWVITISIILTNQDWIAASPFILPLMGKVPQRGGGGETNISSETSD